METVFEDADPGALDPDTDYFAELVGEGKKFKDPKELAKGKVESDRFIDQIIKEKDAMRKELDAKLTTEELLEKIQQTQSERNESNNQKTNVTKETTEVDVSKLVDDKLRERELVQQANHNEVQVLNALQQTLGPDFKTKVNRRTLELGLDANYVKSLMRQQPNVALALFNVPVIKEVFTTPPETRINTTSQFTREIKKDFAFYEKLRASDPRTYWSPKIQSEIFKQASEMGDSFYS